MWNNGKKQSIKYMEAIIIWCNSSVIRIRTSRRTYIGLLIIKNFSAKSKKQASTTIFLADLTSNHM